MAKSEKITGPKANLPECALAGCNRIGVLKIQIYDRVSVAPNIPKSNRSVCCKTHMIRYIQKLRMPRYSKKRMQRLATTMPLTERKAPKRK